MELISDLYSLVKNNKEWIFSGIGVFILSLLLMYFQTIQKSKDIDELERLLKYRLSIINHHFDCSKSPRHLMYSCFRLRDKYFATYEAYRDKLLDSLGKREYVIAHEVIKELHKLGYSIREEGHSFASLASGLSNFEVNSREKYADVAKNHYEVAKHLINVETQL